MADVANQRVLVTGSTRGIGLETARSFRDAGARVFLTGRSSENLEAAKKELNLPGALCDLTDAKSIQELFRSVKAEFGGLDILINNAGIALTGALENHSDEDLRTLVWTNVRAPLLCSREAFFLMKSQQSGLIVNVSSTVGQKPLALLAAYSATKAALEALTLSLRQELAPHGIQMGFVAPGAVATDMAKDLSADFKKRYNTKITPLKPQAVAAAILAFCMMAISTRPQSLILEHF